MEFFSNLSITGSVGITDDLTVKGNIIGTASLASTASYALTASYVIANDTGNATVLLSGSKPQEELPSGSLWYNTTLNNLYIQTSTPSGSKYQQVINEKLTPFEYSGSGGIRLSGSNNSPNSRTDIIVGGTNQIVRGGNLTGTSYSLIGNGSGNSVQGGSYSSILNGTNSFISESSNAAILNGGNNKLITSKYSVIGGYANTIQSKNSINITNAIAGGEINIISESRASFIFGRSNKITGSNDAYILGRSSQATHNNSHVFGYNLKSVAPNTVHVENLHATGEILGTASFAVTSSYSTYAKTSNTSERVTIVSENAPTANNSGSLWWNKQNGNLYIQVAEPTGSNWVPAVSSVAGGEFGATVRENYAGDSWVVNHNLGTTSPIIQIYSGSNQIIPADIQINNSNQLTVSLAEPISGSVVVSTGVGGPTSSSYAIQATSSSYANQATSSSYANQATSASFAETTPLPIYAQYELSADETIVLTDWIGETAGWTNKISNGITESGGLFTLPAGKIFQICYNTSLASQSPSGFNSYEIEESDGTRISKRGVAASNDYLTSRWSVSSAISGIVSTVGGSKQIGVKPKTGTNMIINDTYTQITIVEIK